MKRHRGVGLVGIVVIIGLLLLLAYTVFEYRAQNTLQNETTRHTPDQIRESLITPNRTEEMAEYSLGIHYTLNNFFGYLLHIEKEGGSMDSWCENGKVSRTDPEVLRTVDGILRYPGEIPYIFRPEADDRCYASGMEFAVSANVYGENGLLVPLCMDATGQSGSVANPQTFRCEPGSYFIYKEPWQQ